MYLCHKLERRGQESLDSAAYVLAGREDYDSHLSSSDFPVCFKALISYCLFLRSNSGFLSLYICIVFTALNIHPCALVRSVFLCLVLK